MESPTDDQVQRLMVTYTRRKIHPSTVTYPKCSAQSALSKPSKTVTGRKEEATRPFAGLRTP